MDEIRARGIEPIEIKTLEQRQLLQHHRPLAPGAGLAHGIAAIIVGERRFDARRPPRHVVGGEYAAVRTSTGVENLLRAAEAIDRSGDKTLRP